MPTFPSRTLSITIERPWEQVYAFAANPANMTQWAAGLGSDFHQDGNVWEAQAAGGMPVRISFTPDNPFGVLDHDVHVGSDIVHVALRVMPNGTGATVTFLLLQEGAITDEAFERDAQAVRADLEKLKSILEEMR